MATIAPLSSAPTVLQRTVGASQENTDCTLRLIFLGCEELAPYGPYVHTATLFLDLIALALEAHNSAVSTHLELHVYEVSHEELPPPEAFDNTDGVILPGSFSSAFDQEPWILQLRRLIQDELVAKRRPTLAACFGHQIYAHSFPTGKVIKCPAGAQFGREAATLTAAGRKWLNQPGEDDGMRLYYTHGDMVEKLPPQGSVLASTPGVPVEAAIYFANPDDTKPMAVTFQAHPEYGSTKELGIEKTVNPILDLMHKRGDMSQETRDKFKGNALKEFDVLQKESIQTMVTVGRLLGWFPSS